VTEESEVQRLRIGLAEAEEALQAIYQGTVDALVVRGPKGPQIYTLVGAQEPYRQVVERMNQGALTLSENRQILYSNRHFADLLGYPTARLVGRPFADFVAVAEKASLASLFADAANRPVRRELLLRRRDGTLMPALIAVNALVFDNSPALLLIATDLTAQKHSEEIAAAEKFARSILEQATDAIIVCDVHGRISKASWAAERLLNNSLEGQLLANAVPLAVAEPAEAQRPDGNMCSDRILKRVLQRHVLQAVEAKICTPSLRDRHFLLSAGPLHDNLSNCVGSILTLTDITDRKRAEEHQEMLVAELNHRVKNILAIVQSVAWQTISASQSLAEFKQAFDGRIQAISLAHDVLTQLRWGQVELKQLVERSLRPYHGAGRGMRAEWSGSQLLLPAKLVVPISMVLHELSTNAAKYGAFSAEAGRVEIAWRIADGKVLFTWMETNGPPIVGEINAGFGSKLISRILSYDLAGSAGFDFNPEGLRCTLTFPVPSLQANEMLPFPAAAEG
jgi:PAS domain S-box-containing protein